ncbi:hypothetical protein L210DRAFT_941091, partial [Boletus edulis BED1]
MWREEDDIDLQARRPPSCFACGESWRSSVVMDSTLPTTGVCPRRDLAPRAWPIIRYSHREI